MFLSCPTFDPGGMGRMVIIPLFPLNLVVFNLDLSTLHMHKMSLICADDMNLECLYKKGTQVVLNINKPEPEVVKISMEKIGIVYSKSWTLDCQRLPRGLELEHQKIHDVVSFWVTLGDIYGPCCVYVSGYSMQTRYGKIIYVQCQISTENEPRVTDRAARSLIKLDIEDTTWQNDMDEVEKLVEAIMREHEDPGSGTSVDCYVQACCCWWE